MTEVRIIPVDPTSLAAASLIAALDAYQRELYPPGSVYSLPAEVLKESRGAFLGAFVGDQLVGCGGYVNHADHYGEIKRMYVHADARGIGIGRRLLDALEAHAHAAGLTLMRLETGNRQVEAMNLYERAGYTLCPRFGDYPDNPLSVFMEKRLEG